MVSKNKEFYFSVVALLLPRSVGYVVMSFAVVLSFIKSVFAVGSEEVAVGDIIIFKNIAFFRNCLLCLF